MNSTLKTSQKEEGGDLIETLIPKAIHKMRNKIFSVTVFLDAFEKGMIPQAETKENIILVKEEMSSLLKNINQFEDFFKPCIIDSKPGSLKKVLDRVLDTCNFLAKRKNLKLENQVDESLPLIPMDFERLCEAFEILVKHTINHSPPGKNVSIDFNVIKENNLPWVHCTIKDSGPGFMKENFGEILDPFFQRRQGEMDLGLSISKKIIQDHGGKFFAENLPDRGIKISFKLPGVKS